MAEATGIQQAIESAVRRVLASHLPAIEEDLVRQVLQEVQPLLQPAPASHPPAADPAADLAKAVSQIQAGTTQKEILRALLDSTEAYAGRAALFVAKGGAATGWLGRGFADDSRVHDFHLNVNHGAASQAFHSRAIATGGSAEVDPEFVAAVGAPAGGVIVLPLLLKDKVAALVYADGGQEGRLEPSALEVIVAATSAWLEVAALRKQAQREVSPDGAEHMEAAPAAHSTSSFPDPFAAHAPRHAAPEHPVDTPAAAAAVVGGNVVEAAAAVPAMSPEDADLHRKAQRFARLLMDEIKLYNQAKVAEGRKNRDLYDRLKEDIEKSRATYQKRYGNTAASHGDYFSSELVRSLAEDDASLLGANFRR